MPSTPQPSSPTGHKRLRWILAGSFALLAVVIVVDGFSSSAGQHVLVTGVAAILSAALSVVMFRSSKRAHAIRIRLLAVAVGLTIAFVLLESYLRIFEPFPILTRGSRISLPVNHRVQFKNDDHVPGLDSEIHVSFNSLGFRGPDPPENWDEHVTVLCIGGSTTQCMYLSDAKTWPARICQLMQDDVRNLWLNNAGLDGHSTFGHLHLVDQYVAALRPKVVLLYVGINDVSRNDLNEFDRLTRRDTDGPIQSAFVADVYRRLLQVSDAVALFDSLRRQQMAARRGLTHFQDLQHGDIKSIATLNRTDLERQLALATHDSKCLIGYEDRLTQLVESCERAGCRVVLMTQPVLYGAGKDDVTGIDLERVSVVHQDGWTAWQILSKYNRVTKSVAKKLNVPLIDVAAKLPKSSAYFYDLIHNSNAGASAVAEIVHAELSPIMKQWFPDFAKN